MGQRGRRGGQRGEKGTKETKGTNKMKRTNGKGMKGMKGMNLTAAVYVAADADAVIPSRKGSLIIFILLSFVHCLFGRGAEFSETRSIISSFQSQGSLKIFLLPKLGKGGGV